MKVINFKEVLDQIKQGEITKNIYVADPSIVLSKTEELIKLNLLFLKI